ncbi:MAG: DsbA family protein [Acidiferrobacterales bacterium]|nr:DsbA family protein [Acidiferrobacterales bacterium]
MDEGNNSPTIWYFADPMCSWCWGFSPVIARIREEYGSSVRVSLNMGGLRPGTRSAISSELRNEILHHWESVHRLTGQSFQFENAMPEGFIYDTEPACRAVLTFARLQPARTFEFFSEIQSAFYAGGKDVTQPGVLSGIAIGFGVDETEFLERFQSSEMKEATQKHFTRTREAGIRGFPTLIWQYGDEVDLLSAGYSPYEPLARKLDELLAKTSLVN